MDNESIILDCADIKTIAELHNLFANELSFPSFYGQNWDAFWDAITGLVGMPKTLTFVNYRHLKENFPQDWKILEACLADMNSKYPSINCKVIYQ